MFLLFITWLISYKLQDRFTVLSKTQVSLKPNQEFPKTKVSSDKGPILNS